MKPLPIHAIRNESWDLVLKLCTRLDVEAGETPEYMYSVRTSQRTVTIWTQDGWRDGWYQARVQAVPTPSGSRVKLQLELGAAPPGKAWSSDYIERHLKDLITRVAPGERL